MSPRTATTFRASRMKSAWSRAAIVAAILPVGLAGATGALAQSASGQTLFTQRCGGCHSLEPAPGKFGPALGGVVGRKAGTGAGYAYSPAMKASQITWSAQTIDSFLRNPAALVRDTKMGVSVPNPKDRAEIVAYLKSQGGVARR